MKLKIEVRDTETGESDTAMLNLAKNQSWVIDLNNINVTVEVVDDGDDDDVDSASSQDQALVQTLQHRARRLAPRPGDRLAARDRALRLGRRHYPLRL